MEFRYSFVFLPICWENTFSFVRLKSISTAAVTEQTTEAFDWKLIGFIQRGRIHWNFSHSISMVWTNVNNTSVQYLKCCADHFVTYTLLVNLSTWVYQLIQMNEWKELCPNYITYGWILHPEITHRAGCLFHSVVPFKIRKIDTFKPLT